MLSIHGSCLCVVDGCQQKMSLKQKKEKNEKNDTEFVTQIKYTENHATSKEEAALHRLP